MKIDAVFQGGGVKGIGFVGAVCKLEEMGYEWERLAGTSVGSILAALLAVGYTGKELKRIIMNLNYKELVDKTKLQSIKFIGKYLGFMLQKGIYSSNNIEKWLNTLLQVKGKTKFKHVYSNGEFKLKIIATDITKKDILVFPEGLAKYDIDPMEFEIAKAIRMSIGIPFYFNPYELKYKNEKSLIIDGGVLSNFPIWIFDVEGIPRWPTFGFKFEEGNNKYNSSSSTNIISYTHSIINTMLDKNEEIYLCEKERVRTISIPTLGVGSTEFNITREKSIKLFKAGYASTEGFLKDWDFKSYVQKYRK